MNWKNMIVNMNKMFSECKSLSIIKGEINLENVTINDMTNMFSKYSSLSTLDLNLNWKNVNANMSYMFADCSSLSN